MRAGALLPLLLALPVGAEEPRAPVTRVELVVPAGLEEAVWRAWLERWGSGGSLLSELGPGLCASESEEQVVDDYFDDTRFSLLGRQAALRHRGRWSEAGARRPAPELVVLEGAGGPVEWTVRRLEWQGEPEENVPGLQLLSRGDRKELAASLLKLDVDAMDLVHAFQVQHRRRRLDVAKDDQPWATLTLDQAVVRKLWWRVSFSVAELALVEPRWAAAGPDERRAMEALLERARADLLVRVPEVRPDAPSSTYRRGFAALEERAIGLRPSIVIGLPLFLVLALPVAAGALIGRAARRQAGLASRRWR